RERRARRARARLHELLARAARQATALLRGCQGPARRDRRRRHRGPRRRGGGELHPHRRLRRYQDGPPVPRFGSPDQERPPGGRCLEACPGWMTVRLIHLDLIRRREADPMVTKAFQECLIDVYRGEVVGEAVFEGMLGIAEDAQQKYIIGSLLQFETEGKAIIRPVLMRLGLSMLEDPAGRAGGAAGSPQLNALPWIERFAALQEIVKAKYLPQYLEL